MRAVDIIRAKRDGEALSREAIESFVRGVTDGSWEDYQSSALLMAIVLKGMNAVEVENLAELPSLIASIIEAINAGELDVQARAANADRKTQRNAKQAAA